MSVEHKNIAEDGLHEPKGASTASTGQAYISNGSGSGNWGLISASSLQGGLTNNTPEGRRVVTDGTGGFTSELTPASAYGTINLTNNSTPKTLSAAVDTTLNTDGDYTKLDIALNTSNVLNMGSGNNSLTVLEGGLYMVDFWCSVKSTINATKFGLKFVVNGTVSVPREAKLTLNTNNQIYNLSACGITDFSANDEVSVYIAADKNCDIIIEDMTFRMIYLGALV